MRLTGSFVMGLFGLAVSPAGTYADADRNEQIMAAAAQQLTWESWAADNHAYFLVKQETILAPVAIVFGYADNATACEALAHSLSQPSARVGTFKCQPIY